MTEQEKPCRQDDNEDKAVESEDSSCCCAGSPTDDASQGACRKGLKLLLLAFSSAIFGFIATANWYTIKINLFIFEAEMILGMIILISAVLGFVVGLIFIWSIAISEK